MAQELLRFVSGIRYRELKEQTFIVSEEPLMYLPLPGVREVSWSAESDFPVTIELKRQRNM